MSSVKYIAEGFLEDALKLLNEFIDKNSVEFSVFATIWRKHYFSLIYMGRPDQAELTEFTNEIFKISSQFLSSPSFYLRVGAVYLLYSLFRSQISDPAIKIRIETSHWRIIKSLRIDAFLNKYKSLHFVIDFLIENAFIYVAHQMLKGPTIRNLQKESKNQEEVSALQATYKSDIIEYSASNNLQKLHDLQAEYMNENKKIGFAGCSATSSATSYEKIMQDLKDLVLPSAAKPQETLGSRRAKLKVQSFQRKTQGRFGKTSEVKDDDCDSEFEQEAGKKPIKKKKVIRTKRVPKEERRVGRPSKKKKEVPAEPVSDDDLAILDIRHLLAQQEEFYLPPTETHCKNPRTRRDPYYKLSPKREERDSSDPDNPKE